jgi:hypothetical protein
MSPLTKQWISLVIIIIDFMVSHKSLCSTNSPALLANVFKFDNLLRGNWIPNSLWVRLDILNTGDLIESVNESMQQYALLHMYQLFEWVFHLPIIDLYFNFSTNETLTYLVSYEYLHWLIYYCQWLLHRLSLPITSLSWYVFEMLFESRH